MSFIFISMFIPTKDFLPSALATRTPSLYATSWRRVIYPLITVAHQKLLLTLLQVTTLSKVHRGNVGNGAVVELRVEPMAVEVVMAVESNSSGRGNNGSGTDGKDEP